MKALIARIAADRRLERLPLRIAGSSLRAIRSDPAAISGGGTKALGDLQSYVDGDLISVTVHWRDTPSDHRLGGQRDKAGTTLSAL